MTVTKTISRKTASNGHGCPLRPKPGVPSPCKCVKVRAQPFAEPFAEPLAEPLAEPFAEPMTATSGYTLLGQRT